MDEERYPALPWQGWKIVKRLGKLIKELMYREV